MKGFLFYSVVALSLGLFSAEKPLIDGYAPTFSADGKYMAFQRPQGKFMRVGIMQLSTGKVIWPEKEGNACHPFFAPDNSLVYSYANIHHTAWERFCAHYSDDGYGIRRWKHGEKQDITHGLWRDYQPSVSPDGKTLWFVSQMPGNDRSEHYIASFVFGSAMNETRCERNAGAGDFQFNASVGQPVVSPDGQLLAWTEVSQRYDGWHIYCARIDSLDRYVMVTPLKMQAYAPRWSPDGKFLVFTGYVDGDEGWCAYQYELATGNMKKLGVGEDVTYTADGRAVAYSRNGRIYLREFTYADRAKPMTTGGKKSARAEDAERVLLDMSDLDSRTVVDTPKRMSVGLDGTCFIRARVKWNGNTDEAQVVARVGFVNAPLGLQLYIMKEGVGNMSIRDCFNEHYYLASSHRLKAGEVTMTGIRTKDMIYFSLDDNYPEMLPIIHGTMPLDVPTKTVFGDMLQKDSKIIRVEVGTGWPKNVPQPLKLLDLLK